MLQDGGKVVDWKGPAGQHLHLPIRPACTPRFALATVCSSWRLLFYATEDYVFLRKDQIVVLHWTNGRPVVDIHTDTL